MSLCLSLSLDSSLLSRLARLISICLMGRQLNEIVVHISLGNVLFSLFLVAYTNDCKWAFQSVYPSIVQSDCLLCHSITFMFLFSLFQVHLKMSYNLQI